MPLVTIIIPSYNHAQYIDVAIESVLSQTHQEMELIVTDDGSTDGTHETLEKYRNDPRIRLILNKTNRGQSTVLGEAIRESSGEFIGFLPSDDWYLPKKTERQVKRFEEVGEAVGVVYGRGARFYESMGLLKDVDLPLIRGQVFRRLITEGNFVYPVTPLYRRSVFDLNVFDARYRAEGEAILTKIALHYDFDFVDEVVGVMRDHEYNTGKDVELMYRENVAYWSEFFECVDMPAECRQLRNIRLGQIHRLKGLELIMRRKAFRAGRAALINAVRLRWRYLLDRRVIMGLTLCSLPMGLSNTLIEKRMKRRHSLAAGCKTAT